MQSGSDGPAVMLESVVATVRSLVVNQRPITNDHGKVTYIYIYIYIYTHTLFCSHRSISNDTRRLDVKASYSCTVGTVCGPRPKTIDDII
jgi:hypothetical protein